MLNFEDIRLAFKKKKRAANGATIDSQATEATVADESKMGDPKSKTPKTTSSKITSSNDRDVKTIKNTTPTENTANPTADNPDLNTVKSTMPTETQGGTGYQGKFVLLALRRNTMLLKLVRAF